MEDANTRGEVTNPRPSTADRNTRGEVTNPRDLAYAEGAQRPPTTRLANLPPEAQARQAAIAVRVREFEFKKEDREDFVRTRDKERRIRYIYDEMCAERWVSKDNVSNKATAERFGVSVRTCEVDAAEASRLRAFLMNDGPGLRESLIARAFMVHDLAVDRDQLGAASAYMGHLIRILGIEAPKTHYVGVGAASLDDLDVIRKAREANRTAMENALALEAEGEEV